MKYEHNLDFSLQKLTNVLLKFRKTLRYKKFVAGLTLYLTMKFYTGPSRVQIIEEKGEMHFHL